MIRLLALAALVTLASCTAADRMESESDVNFSGGGTGLDLGQFSISLAVKDLPASRAFYEKLGFEAIGGQPEQNWLILRNGDATIGLFQGMFEENIMTFNPGWARLGDHPESFTDVREIQRWLKGAGLTLVSEADETTTGPASVVLVDPDGNTILLDQHR